MSDPSHWTPEQLFVLHWLYPDFTAEEVAGVFGKTTRGIHQKARQLRISKSDAFKESWRSGRIQAAHTDPRMVDTARVEVDYIRATGQDTSNFIDSLKTPKAQAAITNAPTGKVDRSTPGVTRHTMGDD